MFSNFFFSFINYKILTIIYTLYNEYVTTIIELLKIKRTLITQYFLIIPYYSKKEFHGFIINKMINVLYVHKNDI